MRAAQERLWRERPHGPGTLADLMADAPQPVEETDPEDLLTPVGVAVLNRYPSVAKFLTQQSARMKQDPVYIMANYIARCEAGEIVGNTVGARNTVKAIAKWFETYLESKAAT